MSQSAPAFDPGRYITKVKGSDYLEVKWRLVWLRDQHPDATISTELVTHGNTHAIFRAEVTLPTGGSATGYGSEESSDFGDFLEKAETKAIGRALAALGFGTQFCDDMVYGAAEGRVVDAPVARPGQAPHARQGNPEALFGNGHSPSERGGSGGNQGQTYAPSPKQMSFIRSVARELKMDDTSLSQFTQGLVGSDVDQISRRDASLVIEALKNRQQENERNARA